MIRMLRNWLAARARRRRYDARRADACLLFPVLQQQSHRNPDLFRRAASVHVRLDPNWNGHEDEWRNTPVDPDVWISLRDDDP